MEVVWSILSFLGNQLIGFAFGLAASFVASIYYTKWSNRRNTQQYRSLVGTWIEVNNLLQDRLISICQFYFCSSDGSLKFDGHSYDNDGREYYRWWSVILQIDDRERRMAYIYETQRIGDTKKDEGFGCNVLHFDQRLSRWDIARGYFLDLEEAKPRHTKMRRFEEVASLLKRSLDPSSENDRRLIVEELIKQKEDKKIKDFLGWETL